jgi:hypothetical protein
MGVTWLRSPSAALILRSASSHTGSVLRFGTRIALQLSFLTQVTEFSSTHTHTKYTKCIPARYSRRLAADLSHSGNQVAQSSQVAQSTTIPNQRVLHVKDAEGELVTCGVQGLDRGAGFGILQ